MAPFIPSALGGGEWSTSHPGRFTPDKERLYTLHWWMDGLLIVTGVAKVILSVKRSVIVTSQNNVISEKA